MTDLLSSLLLSALLLASASFAQELWGRNQAQAEVLVDNLSPIVIPPPACKYAIITLTCNSQTKQIRMDDIDCGLAKSLGENYSKENCPRGRRGYSYKCHGCPRSNPTRPVGPDHFDPTRPEQGHDPRINPTRPVNPHNRPDPYPYSADPYPNSARPDPHPYSADPYPNPTRPEQGPTRPFTPSNPARPVAPSNPTRPVDTNRPKTGPWRCEWNHPGVRHNCPSNFPPQFTDAFTCNDGYHICCTANTPDSMWDAACTRDRFGEGELSIES